MSEDEDEEDLPIKSVRRKPKSDITMDWSVEKRTGKIFIDYNMNVRGKTLNVAYSPRGVPGAPVSMPLAWEELGPEMRPDRFSVLNLLHRLAHIDDPWKDMRKQAGRLPT